MGIGRRPGGRNILCIFFALVSWTSRIYSIGSLFGAFWAFGLNLFLFTCTCFDTIL